MTIYQAIIEDTKNPLGYIKVFERKRIDAIKRAILATGKTWPDLNLPVKINPGHYFKASYDGMQITIFKYNH
jgi:hypothetical protein